VIEVLYLIAITVIVLALYGFWVSYTDKQQKREARLKEITQRLQTIEDQEPASDSQSRQQDAANDSK
jgi:Flp pilus assembly protein TadB